jgi:hypothetical protein
LLVVGLSVPEIVSQNQKPMKQEKKSKVRSQDRRIFSLDVKKKTVSDIEKGLCSLRQASLELGVSSVAIYK